MPILVIPYPEIDPVLLHLGPFDLRWYALGYIVGMLIGWRYARSLVANAKLWLKPPGVPDLLDDLLIWVAIGVVVGGRLGQVLLYEPDRYFADPLEILKVWHGGMAFHGGLLGATLAIMAFAWRNGISMLSYLDLVASVAPIGLFLVRLANFVNGELWGRPADVPWAMIFPRDEAQVPRHPSQLYEAGLEGIAMFLLLFALQHRGLRQRPGLISGVFLIGYAVARSIGELFREPDQQLGFLDDFLRSDQVPALLHPLATLVHGVTMGQLLSLPMVLGGLWLIRRAKRLPQTAVA